MSHQLDELSANHKKLIENYINFSKNNLHDMQAIEDLTSKIKLVNDKISALNITIDEINCQILTNKPNLSNEEKTQIKDIENMYKTIKLFSPYILLYLSQIDSENNQSK